MRPEAQVEEHDFTEARSAEEHATEVAGLVTEAAGTAGQEPAVVAIAGLPRDQVIKSLDDTRFTVERVQPVHEDVLHEADGVSTVLDGHVCRAVLLFAHDDERFALPDPAFAEPARQLARQIGQVQAALGKAAALHGEIDRLVAPAARGRDFAATSKHLDELARVVHDFRPHLVSARREAERLVASLTDYRQEGSRRQPFAEALEAIELRLQESETRDAQLSAAMDLVALDFGRISTERDLELASEGNRLALVAAVTGFSVGVATILIERLF